MVGRAIASSSSSGVSPRGARRLVRGRRGVRHVMVVGSEHGGARRSRGDIEREYLKLGNGSDVRGIALGGDRTLTPVHAFFIAESFAKIVREEEKVNGDLKLSIGMDPRVSGPELVEAAAAGMFRGGAAGVLDGTLASTPAIFMSTLLCEVQGGIMMTASHLPPNRNGMKFFTAKGGFDKTLVKQMLVEAARLEHEVEEQGGTGEELVMLAVQKMKEIEEKGSIMPKYAEHLRKLIIEAVRQSDPPDPARPLDGMHIIVDAGNGSGGFFVDSVLKPLGANTDGSQLLEPDGTFPVHIPNPEDKTAMASAAEAVLGAGAELGIVFDTDVDRCGVVAGDGTPINRNRLIAALSDIVLREHPGSTIVTDSVTSAGLTTFIESRGGKHCRFKRGYKNVIDKGIQLNASGEETHLMMETSGHGALKENFYLDDGCYLAVKMVAELAKRKWLKQPGNVKDLYKGLREPKDEYELRLPIKDEANFKEIGTKALDVFSAWIAGKLEKKNLPAPPGWVQEAGFEGVRVKIKGGLVPESGWLLIRQSLHDPLLVLNVETEQSNGCLHVANTLQIWLEWGANEMPGWRDIDITGLKDAAEVVKKGHPIGLA